MKDREQISEQRGQWRWLHKCLLQAGVMALLTALGAGAIYALVGMPERGVVCVQEELKPDEVCWQTVQGWEDSVEVMWVDARSEREYQNEHIDGAKWVPEKEADKVLGENMELLTELGMSGVNGGRVVVYCATDACGGSHFVAQRIREATGHSDVRILHGGWKAVKGAGSLQMTEK